MNTDKHEWNFEKLVGTIRHVYEEMAARSLRQYRQFYLVYPEIWQTMSAKSTKTSSMYKKQTWEP